MKHRKINTANLRSSNIILIIASIFITSCEIGILNDQYSPGYSPGNFIESGDLSFDPQTILASLDQDKADLFVPIQSPSNGIAQWPVGTFAWGQPEYTRIARAVYEKVWQESPDQWSLYEISFVKRKCDDGQGFDLARYVYFDSIDVDGKNRNIVREISINPLYEAISWGESDYYRPTHKWRSIETEEIKLNADEALKISEANGGKDVRAVYGQVCNIDVKLFPDSIGNEWSVRYSDENSRPVWEVLINPESGEYKIQQQ